MNTLFLMTNTSYLTIKQMKNQRFFEELNPYGQCLQPFLQQ